jgi:hypothetical protein
MNTATKITELPALTADLLQSNSCLVDNLFADLLFLNPETLVKLSLYIHSKIESMSEFESS